MLNLQTDMEIAESKKKKQKKLAALDIVNVALMAALMAVCAQITVPLGLVPFTLQTLGVFIAAAMLGWKRGTLSVLVYILLGLVGVPVFAEFSGGVGVLFGPTGGYIIGFIFTALIVGAMTEKLGKKLWVLAASMVLGLIACYIFGTGWFLVLFRLRGESKTLPGAIAACVQPFLLADGVKIALAAILVNRLGKIIKL